MKRLLTVKLHAKSVVVQRATCGMGPWAEAGRPSIRALVPRSSRGRSMQYAECRAISVTIVEATVKRNALTLLLVARGPSDSLRRRERRRVKHRPIAPDRKQNAA